MIAPTGQEEPFSKTNLKHNDDALRNLCCRTEKSGAGVNLSGSTTESWNGETSPISLPLPTATAVQRARETFTITPHRTVVHELWAIY